MRKKREAEAKRSAHVGGMTTVVLVAGCLWIMGALTVVMALALATRRPLPQS